MKHRINIEKLMIYCGIKMICDILQKTERLFEHTIFIYLSISKYNSAKANYLCTLLIISLHTLH